MADVGKYPVVKNDSATESGVGVDLFVDIESSNIMDLNDDVSAKSGCIVSFIAGKIVFMGVVTSAELFPAVAYDVNIVVGSLTPIEAVRYVELDMERDINVEKSVEIASLNIRVDVLEVIAKVSPLLRKSELFIASIRVNMVNVNNIKLAIKIIRCIIRKIMLRFVKSCTKPAATVVAVRLRNANSWIFYELCSWIYFLRSEMWAPVGR